MDNSGGAALPPGRGDVIADEEYAAAAEDRGDLHADGKRSMGIQTVFRDSEAQTDPYTPEFIVPNGKRPEILDIEDMSYSEWACSTMTPGVPS